MFLDKIKEIKEKEFREFYKKRFDVFEYFKSNDFNIISEIKKASPSKGDILPDANIFEIAKEYSKNGASAISILTEKEYFKGNLEYLYEIRKELKEAILLRKDFILYPYQLYEAKIMGADMVLLILALCEVEKIKELIKLAKELNLEVLLEIHTQEEMEIALNLNVNFIGVNNRNLKTLEVSLDVARNLSKFINEDKIFVCESGIKNSKDIIEMKNLGYNSFLIGTQFMQSKNQGLELKKIIDEVRNC